MLTFSNVEKHDRDQPLIRAENLTINKGRIIGIHGLPDTCHALLHIILGKSEISKGEMVLFGESYGSRLKLSTRIGFLLREDGLYERLTVKENLAFTKGLYQSEVSLTDVMEQLRLPSKEKLKNLSPSAIQRVKLGRLLVQNPDLFILEEPDQNVDLETRTIFSDIFLKLKALEKSVVIITSNLESAVSMTEEVYRMTQSGVTLVNMQEEETFEEAEKQVELPRLNKIPAKLDDKLLLFDPAEIEFIESIDSQAHLFISGERFICSFTLAELEERLETFGFFRCHRSYIVNLQKVREIITWTRNSYSLQMENKKEVPLSKSKMAELKERLGMH
ncbi:LytTR family transcriptional regulator DNA-binding domain-containing protein [Paenalkalicoccus suaedae]|uniref:LytTR family transcriptional regulator DNA-binding domain-containing protein n=1 Tax=Paenalkalicoccus suaedae TaxID=2592382 RepID=A0A859FA20_9BACI|nr:LytTR family transcriptional regulator DNA-binding domain-containing protein [Paenalkalicoccus suaedae]QKS70073.1 LytTR family transcriptional regulator DNA-binding domain-containing protein [Paenalkalicoccus suaedae]